MLWCVRDDDNVCMQMSDGGDEQTQYLCDSPVRDGEEVHTLIMQFIRLGVELFCNNRFAKLLQYGKSSSGNFACQSCTTAEVMRNEKDSAVV